MTAAGGTLWIKVCGMRSEQAIAAAAAAGANAVGFVFHEPSPRHLEAAQARDLAASVPAGIEKVAVFLHPSQATLDAALAAVRPDWVQTDFADLDSLRLPPGQRVMPVFRTGRAEAIEQLDRQRFPQVLLESGRSGFGERADWVEAARIASSIRTVLAGGLDAGNVADAVATVRPFGVDVSSGVERTRGVKDVALIHEFVQTARTAEARLASSSMGESH
jgi:phosphoribosylanthranilate isomerase